MVHMREVLLIFHFIGLAMGLGTSFAYMFLGIAASKMEQSRARQFQINTLILTIMGRIGLALLIISGLFLMAPYWIILPTTPLLIIKLTLVIFLTVLLVAGSSIAKKAKTSTSEVHFKKLETMGKFSLLTTLAIVILAVSVFQ